MGWCGGVDDMQRGVVSRWITFGIGRSGWTTFRGGLTVIEYHDNKTNLKMGVFTHYRAD